MMNEEVKSETIYAHLIAFGGYGAYYTGFVPIVS